MMNNLKVTVLIFLFLLIIIPSALSAEQMSVSFIDAGNGDAVFIKTSQNNILIDAGPDGEKVTNFLSENDISQIDMLIITSPTAGRIGGINNILNTTFISKYYDSGYNFTSASYLKLLDDLKNADVVVGVLGTGDKISIGDTEHFEVIRGALTDGESIEDGMIFSVTSGDVKFLFTADKYPDLSLINDTYQIIKMPGHGEWNSNCQLLLTTVSPEVAIISACSDEGVLPSDNTIKTIKGIPAKLFRTDESGTITFTTDGSIYQEDIKKEFESATLSVVSVVETRPPK